jgi:hypothetical protein
MVILKFKTFLHLGIFILLVYLLSGCKKDKFLTEGGKISYSTDTLKFDTVFTTVGSVTRAFKIYNDNNRRINLERIKLKGGTSSPFRMNIDGEATKDIQNIEIAANDSIYVFVALTVNPTSGNLPFIVNDAVEVMLNGQQSEVKLEAYGQDAHYIKDTILMSQFWENDKPYVLSRFVYLDSTSTLNIQKGCRIYMHQDCNFYIGGTLNVFGTKQDSVIFQGDRLDRDYFGYKDYPGEWRGIRFLRTSEKSKLNYAVIKNGGFADASIIVEPPKFFDINHPSVELTNCIIANSLGFGILAFNGHIRATNCLVHSCGAQNIAFLEGGTYFFDYCTMATYGSTGINHSQEPTAAFLNYRDVSLTEYVGNNLNATFNNCIIYGPLEDEVIFGKRNDWDYNVNLNNCLIKRTTAITNAVTNACILNSDPQFVDYSKWNYHPKSTSPVKLAGKNIPSVLDDLDGTIRNVSQPSIGCYEVP